MDKAGRRPDCYVQVNTGEEAQKAGVLPKDVDAFVTACRDVHMRVENASTAFTRLYEPGQVVQDEQAADQPPRAFGNYHLARVGNGNQSEGGGMRRTILLITVLLLALAPSASAKDNFVATLSGDEEVPARDTQAVGVAKFKLSKDGTALKFKVNVSNIQNVFAAHIHCGVVGVNGPVGVTLFAGAPAGGKVNGTLAEGTITAPDPGNGCGCPPIATHRSWWNLWT